MLICLLILFISKYISTGLDYKILMSGKETLFNVIQPILNENNVNVLAKLASKIPDQVCLNFYKHFETYVSQLIF